MLKNKMRQVNLQLFRYLWSLRVFICFAAMNYIIGTIGKLDTPKNPDLKIFDSDAYYMKGVPEDFLQKTRSQVLSTTVQDIVESADILESIIGQSKFAVIGSEGKINANKEMFNSIMQVMK